MNVLLLIGGLGLGCLIIYWAEQVLSAWKDFDDEGNDDFWNYR